MTTDKQDTPRTDALLVIDEFINAHCDLERELTALRASIEAAELPEEPGEPFIHAGPNNIPLPCVDAELHKRWQDYSRKLRAQLAAVMAERDEAKRDYQQIVDYVMGYFPIGLCYVNPLQAIEVVIDRMKKAEQRLTEAESRAARAGEDAKKWQLLQRAATRNPLPNDPAAIEEWAKRLANDVKDAND